MREFSSDFSFIFSLLAESDNLDARNLLSDARKIEEGFGLERL